MEPTETARVEPAFGARELRVYQFQPDQLGEQPERAVWVGMASDCVSARCRLTPEEARQVAAGMLTAADAAEGITADGGRRAA